MRKHRVAAALIVVLAAVWASSASAISGPQTLSVLEVDGQSMQQMGDFALDRAPAGGDQIGVRNTLYSWAGAKRGAKIGHDQVVITFITGWGADFSKTATVLFTAQMYLPGGTILVSGYGHIKPDGPSHQVIPVIGGTGTYANARGYLEVRDIGNGRTDKTALTFHLLP